jgi:hypothetical protein
VKDEKETGELMFWNVTRRKNETAAFRDAQGKRRVKHEEESSEEQEPDAKFNYNKV